MFVKLQRQLANIGIGNASYYADNSISRLNRQVGESVEKVSSNKSNVTNGDKSSLVSMDNTFKLDLAATNAAVKNMSVAQAYLSTAISTLDNASARWNAGLNGQAEWRYY